VHILKAETPWRTARIIFTRKVRNGWEVADVAIELAAAVHAGARPWADEPPEWTGRSAIKKVMNWD
jgi:hypothetical protein